MSSSPSDPFPDPSPDPPPDPPSDPPARSSTLLLRNLLRFGHLLRRLGLAVTSTDLRLAAVALGRIDLGRRDDVRATLAAVMVRRREHLAIFERAFALFWTARALRPSRQVDLGRMMRPTTRAEERLLLAIPGEPPADDVDGEEATVVERRVTWSARETLRHKDFAELTEDEERQVRHQIQERTLRLKPRRTRRLVRAVRGRALDRRAMLRAGLRRGGEPSELLWRRRKTRRRPLVVLCDVSGSMEVYSRLFLLFLYTLREAGDRPEIFAFGTRLTRLTHLLRERRVDRALRDAAAAIVDWGGGTRIGESLRVFHRDWGRRVLGRGAIVMVISDGWDRGDVALLERQVARLGRRSRRLIWLNPLLGSAGYEPRTRGIRAVLPWIDDFLPLYNLASLDALRDQLEALEQDGPGIRGRRQQDRRQQDRRHRGRP